MEEEMKKFKMRHLYFRVDRTFTEDDPPWWLTSDEFNWWWKDYVLTLEVGESIDSDFHRIERIE
jgi:hypothetical protein